MQRSGREYKCQNSSSLGGKKQLGIEYRDWLLLDSSWRQGQSSGILHY
jgi:hypothetical protein